MCDKDVPHPNTIKNLYIPIHEAPRNIQGGTQ